MTRPCPLQPSPIFCHVISSTRVPPMFGEPIFKNGIISPNRVEMTQKWSKWPITATQTTHVPHSSGHKHWSLLASSTHTLISIKWYEIENIASQRSPNVTRLKIMWRCGALLSRVTGVPARNSNVTPSVWLRLWFQFWFHFIIWVKVHIADEGTFSCYLYKIIAFLISDYFVDIHLWSKLSLLFIRNFDFFFQVFHYNKRFYLWFDHFWCL